MAKVIIKNKEAFFNYEILEKFEAGIELSGWEVKSIREGRANLKSSFCSFKGKELFISNFHISNYMQVVGDEVRPKKLLLHKSQLKKLKEKIKLKGYSIIPTTLKWSSKGYVKIDIGVAKGKRQIDKRETIKKREFERNLKKTIKNMGV